MDETLKKYFASGPPEMTRKQLEDLCASMAMSYIQAFEPAVLLDRNKECAYGYPKEDA